MNSEMITLMLDEIRSLEIRIREREEIEIEEQMAIAKHEKSIKENAIYMADLKNSLRMFKSRLGMN